MFGCIGYIGYIGYPYIVFVPSHALALCRIIGVHFEGAAEQARVIGFLKMMQSAGAAAGFALAPILPATVQIAVLVATYFVGVIGALISLPPEDRTLTDADNASSDNSNSGSASRRNKQDYDSLS